SGVPALRDITFDIKAGEVQALLGENGAGKSTLMKILSGAYEPTTGSIVIDGVTHSRLTTKQSQAAGISIIYQELSVINQLSIAENIFVGRLPGSRQLGLGVVDHRTMRDRTRQLLDEVGLKRDPDTIVGHLSISEKQMVEIAKAIAFDCRIIVMDEPTSSLTEEEVDRLFHIVGRLRDRGTAVVYISHKLKEVMALAQRVTVLKDGVAVATKTIDEVTIDSLVQLMVGRELKDKYLSEHASQHHALGPKILEVTGLTRRDNLVRNVTFSLRKGEVLGFSGLVGAGRSELMSAIYGAAPIRAGSVKLHGKELKIRTPYDALKHGISMVTEDRRHTGIFRNFSIRRNIAIGTQLKTSKLGGLVGLIDSQAEREMAENQVFAMQVKCRDLEQNIVELSGGNQQKVLLGRQMAAGCDVIIFDEPTKGIDVGTKSEIYSLMRSLADNGIGVIVVSSELPEILAVCDRILVFAEGEITAEFTSDEATEEALVKAAAIGIDTQETRKDIR
ncbi:MAG: ATP-binding cassette domain-containing protein, partial [Propionicimonas sp.]